MSGLISGLPDEIAPALFEFYRRRRTPTAGAGLGLSIAKGIVEAHGGRIERTTLERGTRFSIHLPVEHADPARQEGEEPEPSDLPEASRV